MSGQLMNIVHSAGQAAEVKVSEYNAAVRSKLSEVCVLKLRTV